MNIIGYILIWFLFLILDKSTEYEVDKEMQDKGYIRKSRYDKAMKYASSNIVSIEKSNKDKLIGFFKTLIYFIPIINVLKLVLSLSKYPLIDLYICYLKKHDKLLDANSLEADFTYDIEKQVESLQNEKISSFINKINEFLGNFFEGKNELKEDAEKISSEDDHDAEIANLKDNLDEAQFEKALKKREYALALEKAKVEKARKKKEYALALEKAKVEKARKKKEYALALEKAKVEKALKKKEYALALEKAKVEKIRKKREYAQALEEARIEKKHIKRENKLNYEENIIETKEKPKQLILK